MSKPRLYVPGTSVIDIAAPGGIDALLAFHRVTFGDAVMEATGGDGGDSSDAGGGSDADAGAGDGAADGSQDGAQQADEPWADPAKAKAEIERLRREAGAQRTTAKAQAAEKARTDLVQQLGKALGLVEDGSDAPTPEQLTEQLTAAQAAQRQAAVELAVYRTATQHGADPAALTDSRTFLAKVATLDPTAEDFTTKVVDAAKAAATENPKLKAAPVAGASSVDHAGGTGEPRTPKSLADAVGSAYTR